MLDGIDVFRITGARMRHLAERQNILAQNIANADTPLYRARDVKPFQFNSALLRSQPGAPALQLASTRPGHMGRAREGVAVTADRAEGYSEDPDGNTVNLEEQMVKQADVAKAYDLATLVYRRGTALLRTAAGGR
ncbi:flagellar biosynthesis protein FlgG [Pseudoroseomonas rhizosphaerae]|uniref:Flagellar biosynthesis protein FlgG n=1 Tax=Teichococcus rhizosphaerae TaxID=1335062 RepID=A0A2C7AAQ7_9PROT|nr:flagellar basal body protein [Pseudoroseomonas rhizosphaerae]PHK93717.1 flagellar biosynthesis protein FlgG [Pseudoroseomonas rhizosphaerae]